MAVTSVEIGHASAPVIGIDRARQAVGQRHAEHVVGRWPGRISGTAGVVKERDLEASETGLFVDNTSMPPPASCSPLAANRSYTNGFSLACQGRRA